MQAMVKCTYDGFEVIHRLGSNPILRIGFKIDFTEDFEENFPLLLVNSKFRIKLYEVTKDLRTRSPKDLIDEFIGGGILVPRAHSDIVRSYVDISMSRSLINSINEIKSLGKLPAFEIKVEWDGVFLKYATPKTKHFSTLVYKHVFGEEQDLVVFTTDEIDLLMRDLKYVETLRVELPLPIKVEHVGLKKIVKSVEEIMVAKEDLAQGKYDRVLNTCRNIIMNYLTKREARDKLTEEIVDYIISKIPEQQKSLYADVLSRIGKTIYGLLQHLHKFIKEDTGKLIANPLRGDAEYAFFTLFSIIKYLAELSTRW